MAAELRTAWSERARRLEMCGRAGVMLTCRGCEAGTLVPFRCGARTCPTCSRAHAAGVVDRIAARIAVHDLLMEAQRWDGPGRAQRRGWKMVTLTARADADPAARFTPTALARQVRRVRRAFSRWWRLTPWGRQTRDAGSRRKRSRRDASYVLALEVAPGGMVHVHVLVYGEYVAQRALEGAWSRALGEPAILHIRAADAGALREVLKYATKGEKGTRSEARRAAAVELALRGVRRVEVGGALRNVRVDAGDGESDDGRDDDLHARREACCEACGLLGEWQWTGIVSAESVHLNGGYGLVRVERHDRAPPRHGAAPTGGGWPCTLTGR